LSCMSGIVAWITPQKPKAEEG